MTQIATLFSALFAGTLLGSTAATPASSQTVSISSEPIVTFRKGSDETRFGALDYIGGFSFAGGFGSTVGGLSGLAVDGNGEAFLAVTDNGDWVSGRVVRDASGVPTGLADVRSDPILGPDGAPFSGKLASDAEGLSVRGDDVFVSFEREPRILSYRGFPRPEGPPTRSVDIRIPAYELRQNEGLEALAIAPDNSPLGGAMVTIAEGSIDTGGNLFAAIVEGPAPGVFKLRKDERWDATDADFLPDGDLLVLERLYEGIMGGLGARIRRIAGDSIAAGALVDGPVIFEADLSEEIDNMEGLSVWQDGKGRTRLTLISDDNTSFLQRNLLLEFVLAE